MIYKHGVSRLLDDLHDLYYKVCAIDLRDRMSLYHRNKVARDAPDIAASLTKRFQKLIPSIKPDNASTTHTTSTISSKKINRPDNA